MLEFVVAEAEALGNWFASPHRRLNLMNNLCQPIIESICGSGASVTRSFEGPTLTVIQRSHSSVVEPMPPALMGVPRLPENSTGSILKHLATTAVLTAAVAPFERVKLLMQNQNAIIKSGRLLKPYNGIFNCFATTIRNEGFFSLWRGNIALTIGHISTTIIYFISAHYALSHVDAWSSRQMLVCAYATAVATPLLVYPFKYAGTRMATDVKTIHNMNNRQFNGIFDIFRKTLKSDGITGPYRGFNIFISELCVFMSISAGLKPWEQHYSCLFQSNDFSRHLAELVLLICPFVACYPLDTVSRRMMMMTTSGGGDVKYKRTQHAFEQILKTEGLKSFYSGARAEILVLTAYKGAAALLLIYLASVGRAAKAKPDDDHGSESTFTITCKGP
ncbi:ADP/ATP carrier 3 [Hibiscus trionum]|uniref:ADP/ATP translocase n=1 Tax=Hibiscus trionum TaxID=183268 RepID=A0A9W7IBP7_HIBTR|nr:ADP/ATP carrier 3 [Hibiscus trionum]